MELNCLVCNENFQGSIKRPGPASVKVKSSKNGISKSLCITLCKALNIPVIEYQDQLVKFPVCQECHQKVQKMTKIITTLENLQNTIHQFQWEIRDMLEKSYEAVTNAQIAFVKENYDDKSDINVQNELRKNILDILQQRKAGKRKCTKRKKIPSETEKIYPKSIKVEPGTEMEIEAERKLIVPITPLDLNTISLNQSSSEVMPTFKLVTETEEEEKGNPNIIRDVLESDNDNDEDWLASISDENFSDQDDEFIVPRVSKVFSERRTKRKVKPKRDKDFVFFNSKCDQNRDLAKTKNEPISPKLPPTKPNYKKKPAKPEQKFCEECNRHFKNEAAFQIHFQRKHLGVKRPFVCSVEGCEKTFRQRYLWNLHEKSHEAGVNLLKKYNCETCGKIYESNNSLQRHMSIHTGAWKFPCGLCDKGFHRPGELRNHLAQQHNKDPSYKCNYCDEKFLTSRLRIFHHSTAHPDEDLKTNTKCEYCLKIFSGLDALRCHKIQVHQTEEYPFSCDICKKGFAKSSWLERHKLQHSMEKTFACDICPEKFRFPNSLATHKMKHENNYPFQCRFCPKKCLLRTQLNLHETTHSKDRPYICEYCGKTFSLPVYLNHHTKRLHFKELGLEERPKYYSKDSERRRVKKPASSSTLAKKTKPKRKVIKKVDSVESINIDELILEQNKPIQIELVYGELITTEDDAQIVIQDQREIDEAAQTIQELHQVGIQLQHLEQVGEEKIETDQFIEFIVSHEHL